MIGITAASFALLFGFVMCLMGFVLHVLVSDLCGYESTPDMIIMTIMPVGAAISVFGAVWMLVLKLGF